MTTLNLAIEQPQKESLIAEASKSLSLAESITIDSATMYEAAAEEVRAVKVKIKELEARRKEITGPLDAAKKSVMDLFRQPIEMLEKAGKILGTALVNYDNEQARIKRERQALLDAEARKERERLAEEAAALAEAGRTEEAAAKLDTAAVISAPTVEAVAEKPSGISYTERWHAEVTDIVALCRFVAENPDQRELVTANTVALNGMARALKGSMRIPGVKPVSERTTTVRTTEGATDER